MQTSAAMPTDILIAAVMAALIFFALAAFLIIRAERGRAKAVAAYARAEERAKIGEAAAADLAIARADLDRAGRQTAALSADVENAKARIAALFGDVGRSADELRALREEKGAAERLLERERAEAKGLERQIADLKEAKEQMRQSFGETASALLTQHSENFKAQNSEQIGHLLTPLKNDIDAFKKSLVDAHGKTLEQHGSLKEQLEQLGRQSAAVSKEAENLTRALKGDVQLQGAWGEMIVDTILKRLGLREGVEYSRQESFTDAAGRARTDYILRLPQGDCVVIDSKVSLVDYEKYVNAVDDEARAAHRAAHARSLRAHVKGLSSKDYHAKVGTRLDFVVMFVPIEAALGAAIAGDDTLTLDALDQKVAIATPTTLTTTIQTIAAMWKVERQHQHAEAIAARAGALYDKFNGFVGDMKRIGERLDQAQSAYGDAFGKLKSGAGNLVRQTEILKAMGAKTSKGLPQDLLEAAGADDAEALLQIEAALSEEASPAARPVQ